MALQHQLTLYKTVHFSCSKWSLGRYSKWGLKLSSLYLYCNITGTGNEGCTFSHKTHLGFLLCISDRIFNVSYIIIIILPVGSTFHQQQKKPEHPKHINVSSWEGRDLRIESWFLYHQPTAWFNVVPSRSLGWKTAGTTDLFYTLTMHYKYAYLY